MIISNVIKKYSLFNFKNFFTDRNIDSLIQIIFFIALIIIGLYLMLNGIKTLKVSSFMNIGLLYSFIIIKLLTLTYSTDTYPQFIVNLIGKINDFSRNYALIFWICVFIIPIALCTAVSFFKRGGTAFLLIILFVLAFVDFDFFYDAFPSLRSNKFIIWLIYFFSFLVVGCFLFFFGTIGFLILFSLTGAFFTLLGFNALFFDLWVVFKKDVCQCAMGSRILDYFLLIVFLIAFIVGIYLQLKNRKYN